MTKEIDTLYPEHEIEEIEPDSLILEVGEKIMGTFVGKVTRKDQDGKPREIIMLDTEEGIVGIPECATLKRKFEKIKVNEIVILDRYAEDGVGKKGRPFKRYKVYRAKQKKKE